jgi:O-antigen/teichoic acid export membrane protein
VSIAAAVLTLFYAMAVASGRLAPLLDADSDALMAASIGIMSAALFRIGLAGLRAVGRPVAGQFYEGMGSFIFVAIVAVLWFTARAISAPLAVLLFFACQLSSVAIIWAIIRRDARDWAAPEAPNGKELRIAGIPIMAIQGTMMFQDWLLFALVGGAASAAAVGALRVAMQVVLVIGVVVQTGETFIAAKVAGDIRAGRPDLVWKRHRRATLAMALATGPLVLVCILFPAQLLGFAFGPAFVSAAPALAIMAAGQASKIATGPIGGLMSMSGHQVWLMRFTIIGLALLVVLALWLVPLYGLIGAAIANAVSVVFRNVASFAAAWILIPKTPTPTDA